MAKTGKKEEELQDVLTPEQIAEKEAQEKADAEKKAQEEAAEKLRKEEEEAAAAKAEEEDRKAKEAQVQTSKKSVKIHITESVDCYIAQVRYNLQKDKDYSVPSDVAAVLVTAKKAYRI